MQCVSNSAIFPPQPYFLCIGKFGIKGIAVCYNLLDLQNIKFVVPETSGACTMFESSFVAIPRFV